MRELVTTIFGEGTHNL